MRTFAPQLFVKYNVKKDFPELYKVCKCLMVPKLSEDNYRLSILKLYGCYPTLFMDLFQFSVIINEHLKFHDYSNGHMCFVDLRDANIFEIVTKMNPIELRNTFTLVTKGYGVRIKSIHFLTPSKTIEALLSLFKQVLSPKITSRIKVHKTIEEVYEYVPRYMLPEDYGGEEISLEKISDAWKEEYSKEDFLNYLKEMQAAGTDESRRRTRLDDSMFGVPGTFRKLDFD